MITTYDAPPTNAIAPMLEHHASTCRWATPTMFLSNPVWLEAEKAPWACVRGACIRVLKTTDPCADCPHWELR